MQTMFGLLPSALSCSANDARALSRRLTLLWRQGTSELFGDCP